jgi:2-polyprenyl-3-methyl-5-hydroxy-6-metoxy-1,4-benzoquinol methylase
MDRSDLDPARHAAALRGLARINWWSRSAGILWQPLAALARRLGRPVRVLDVASGGGDLTVGLWKRAAKSGVALHLEGCDLSPVAVAHAQALVRRAGANIRFFVHDALNGPFLPGYDALVSSLFLHHLDEEQAVGFLRQSAETAAHLVLVNDLERSRSHLMLAHLAVRVLTTSEVVRFDGPASVEGAYTPTEALALAERAGLRGATAARRWPFRYLLRWERP